MYVPLTHSRTTFPLPLSHEPAQVRCKGEPVTALICSTHIIPERALCTLVSFVGMLLNLLSLLQLLLVAPLALAQNWTANPFIPPAAPLAVKTPYLQTWLQETPANSSLTSWWQSYRDGSVGHLPVLIPWIPGLTSRLMRLESYLGGLSQSGQPILRLDGRPAGERCSDPKRHDCACLSVL